MATPQANMTTPTDADRQAAELVIPSTDPFYELVCIFQRGLKSVSDETPRPHKILLNLTGEDLVRIVQLCLVAKPKDVHK